jgi:hypothetical protein
VSDLTQHYRRTSGGGCTEWLRGRQVNASTWIRFWLQPPARHLHAVPLTRFQCGRTLRHTWKEKRDSPRQLRRHTVIIIIIIIIIIITFMQGIYNYLQAY